MGEKTGIEWTDHSWSPWWGCTEVSPGCDNCYARTLSSRWGFDIWGAGKARRSMSESHWSQPIKWDAKARRDGVRAKVFPSMCDPFDNEVPVEWRDDFWALINHTPNLTWLLLTKRVSNAAKMVLPGWLTNWPRNAWLGISVVNQDEADRDIPKLLAVPARVRFISYEPALGPITLAHSWMNRLSWIICGGESGPKARPFDLAWARSIIHQCRAFIPCFVKQLGADPRCDGVQFPAERRMGGWDLKGGDMELWPADLRVREFPMTEQTRT